MRLIAFLISLLMLYTASPALASGSLTPILRFQSIRVGDNTNTTGNLETTNIVLDLRVGHVFDDTGLYLGGLYKYEADVYINGSLRGKAYGPSIGYQRGDLSLIVSYIMKAEREYSLITVPRNLRNGKGWQIDFSWTPHLADNFGLGPNLSWHSLRYANSQIGTAGETGDEYNEVRFVPGLAFWYRF